MELGPGVVQELAIQKMWMLLWHEFEAYMVKYAAFERWCREHRR